MPLKRHPALAPLSREHHPALLLARGLQRGVSSHLRAELPAEPAALAAHVCAFFDTNLAPHFLAEELVLEAARGGSAELVAASRRIEAEHAQLREMADSLRRPMEPEAQLDLLDRFGALLEAHVREEERSLYEGVQQVLDEDALRSLGVAIDHHRGRYYARRGPPG
jgi:uncharacterized protein (DUF1778 family)